MRLLCRNRVANHDAWRAIFSAHAGSHREAGLVLDHMWRDHENPNNIWFVFEVTEIDKSREFMNAPEAEVAARETNVLDSECHFVDEASGY